MNKETKFRAWDEEDKKMRTVTRMTFGLPATGADAFLLHCDDGTEDPKSMPMDCHDDECIHKHAILMQYTGRKDKNEKEIYERDIVTDKYGLKHEIKFYTGLNWDGGGSLHSGFYVSDGELDYHCGFDDFTVIGNTCENPELLKNT